ncbi:MAG TPA: gluconokinase [Ktedonobacteraceae bacterium]|nr:gluconokinase [Ktedonobacteraceae bacterium]
MEQTSPSVQTAHSMQSHPKLPFVLALDVGTSSTRALLFDATGTAVPGIQAQETYGLALSNEGEVSVDADMLVETVASTIDKALKAAGPLATSIGAVAADTFWHSLVAVDKNGHPVTPVITWEDTRPRQAAAELRSQLDNTTIHQRTGARLHASYWPAKLRWLAQTQPDAFKRAARFLSFGEYLHQQLLGQSVCSYSMASGTGMLVTRTHTWDEELMKVTGVRPEQMPELGDVQDSVKGLRSEYASRWPTLHNVPWFPAIGDGAAANAGSGCATEGNWALTIGTSSAMRLTVSPDQVVPPPGLWLYLLDANRALLGGALSEGGNMFAWMEQTLKLPSLKDAEPLVSNLTPDGHGLTILPFISGERSLGWHAEARAVVSGIQTHTSPAALLRAAMESLAYQIGAVYTALRSALNMGEKTPNVIGSGGALLSSPTLQHIVADTLRAPIKLSREHEASARGVALLALSAMGVLPDIGKISPDLGDTIQPDPQQGDIYQKAAARQMELYKALLGDRDS